MCPVGPPRVASLSQELMGDAHGARARLTSIQDPPAWPLCHGGPWALP